MNIPGHSTVEKHKDPPHRLIIHIAPVILIIQRKSCPIQRKNLKFSNFKFLALKSLLATFLNLSQHYWGPDASFETHNDMQTFLIYHTLMCHITSYLTIMTYYDAWFYDIWHKCIWQYGYQKKRHELRNTSMRRLRLLTMT